MIRLEPWRPGVPGSGYVLRQHAGLVHVEINRAGSDLNPILQLMQIETSLGLSIGLLRSRIVASVEVKPDGAFRVHSRLDPCGVVGLIDEIMVVDPRLWFCGSRWRWQ